MAGWKIPSFNREYIFKRPILHCHVSLLKRVGLAAPSAATLPPNPSHESFRVEISEKQLVTFTWRHDNVAKPVELLVTLICEESSVVGKNHLKSIPTKWWWKMVMNPMGYHGIESIKNHLKTKHKVTICTRVQSR